MKPTGTPTFQHFRRALLQAAAVATIALAVVLSLTAYSTPVDGTSLDSLAPSNNSITFTNYTDEVITAVILSPCGAATPDTNQIRRPIAPLASSTLNAIPDGCYTIRTIGDFGGEYTVHDADLAGAADLEMRVGIRVHPIAERSPGTQLATTSQAYQAPL